VIAIIDYGLGNLRAFQTVYERSGKKVIMARSPSDIEIADHIILPGVGSFDWAMELISRSGLLDALSHKVMVDKTPVLGICVGLQMMCHRSDEGSKIGLGWIDAEVKSFAALPGFSSQVLPHMGWNSVTPSNTSRLFSDDSMEQEFYFLHSYYVSLNNNDDAACTSDYCGSFVSGVECDNVFGVQFHPEKSHKFGTEL